MSAQRASSTPRSRADALRNAVRLHGLELATSGDSMLPTLRTGDTVTIAIGDHACRFGDVGVFVSRDGSVVVHRFVAQRHRKALFLGDNRQNFDSRIPTELIIGRTTERPRRMFHLVHVLGVLSRAAWRRLRALASRNL